MKVEGWLVLKAKPGYGMYNSGPYQGQQRIAGARIVRITQNKPSVEANEVTMKVELDIDESWFLDGTATITAAVPAAPASSQVIPATVDLPVKGRPKSAAASLVNP